MYTTLTKPFSIHCLSTGMVTVSWFICLYFAVLIAYIMFFLISSFTSELPWSTCDNSWNTVNCFIRNGTVDVNATVAPRPDGAASPSSEFFYNNVLRQSAGNNLYDYDSLRNSLTV